MKSIDYFVNICVATEMATNSLFSAADAVEAREVYSHNRCVIVRSHQRCFKYKILWQKLRTISDYSGVSGRFLIIASHL